MSPSARHTSTSWRAGKLEAALADHHTNAEAGLMNYDPNRPFIHQLIAATLARQDTIRLIIATSDKGKGK